MDETLLKAVMYLLVGIAVLLCGMRFMSSGLKKMAGKGLRNFFRKTQNNPVIGMGIGAAITVIIQSSDATSALVIGFINAGVMTIFQGLSIILGGYIGTTITGIMASFSSVSISVYLLSFAFIGTVLMFFNYEKVKNIGEILCGLGLLFFGLAVMKDAFGNATIKDFFSGVFGAINYPIVLFLVGIAVTALVQSSSAVTGITIAMVGGGALGLSGALYIALGATLGTVATTLLSSLSGNIEGKRTAIVAFALRALTSIVALLITMIFEPQLVALLQNLRIQGSDEFPLAIYIVSYNVIFMPLLLPLLKPTIKLFTSLIKDKQDKNLVECVHFIDDKLLKSPEIALMQVGKEIIHMLTLAKRNYTAGLAKIIEYTNSVDKEIAATEAKVDYLNNRITDFLIKLAPMVQSKDERKVGAYFHVINDIERIGDHGFNFSQTSDAMNREDLGFSQAAKDEIVELDIAIRKMFDIAEEVFVNKDRKSLHILRELEEKIHELKQDFYQHHYERVLKEQCSHKMTPYISSIIVELERVADHLTNIGYSIVNPTGDFEAPLIEQKPRRKRKAK